MSYCTVAIVNLQLMPHFPRETNSKSSLWVKALQLESEDSRFKPCYKAPDEHRVKIVNVL